MEDFGAVNRVENDQMYIFYAILGYLSGSVLYARVMADLFGVQNMIEQSKDKNPGTANAFLYGGMKCGILTLICDIMKGFLPVYLYVINPRGYSAVGLALVMAAPVIGHAFPLFNHFNGGKAIAVTFGAMFGVIPAAPVVLIFMTAFILFSSLVRIQPHSFRTLAAYLTTAAGLWLVHADIGLILGFVLITMVVSLRLHISPEEKEELKVSFLWMH